MHTTTEYLNRYIIFISLLLSISHSHATAVELCKSSPMKGNQYFVSLVGHDYKGDGSRLRPYRTIDYAIYMAKDDSTIIVTPGTYKGETRIKKGFKKGLLLKSEFPYLAKLTNNSRVLAIVGNASNIIIEGFEITHSSKKTGPVLIQFDGYATDKVHHVTLRNSIIHNSFNNDLVKINNGVEDIKIECNMFYNQGDSDEHIDINSVKNITVSDNVFFNDFKKNNRKISLETSSYIVIKDSNSNEDQFLGSQNINVLRNVFFNWQGSRGQGFVLIGEDGKPYFEANNVTIANNLMIGNSPIEMRSPFGVKGAQNIQFYHNTIVGDLPSQAFAFRINTEKNNPVNNNISFYNNIWSDPFSTMGQGPTDKNNDFSDTLHYQLDSFTLHNNVYWNGGSDIPSSFFDRVNIDDDPSAHIMDPKISSSHALITPIWKEDTQNFDDNSYSIRDAFKKIVLLYGIPKQKLNFKSTTPITTLDILGNIRKKSTVGAVELD